MTELDMSDINIDFTYQDGLRLSELYGKLGELQYNLEHLDFIIMQDHLVTTALLIFLFALIGVLVYLALDYICAYSKHETMNIIIGMALYALLAAVVIYIIWDYTAICTELKLEREIQSTQMQIDAILMKYGWEGI